MSRIIGEELMEHPAFKLIRTESIKSLNIEVQEYEHLSTGAKHYHLASDNSENAFMVAFRTVPTDSTGVAHILEHTALCGSEKFPVRDPFFMMLRRSLNTYMNAVTGSDWTAYPFATQCKKDFNNLLDVYLDAVFFSRLDELDFAQEGWRYEFSKADDSKSPLEYKGIVFNEMKGAMSSPVSIAWQALTKHVFPTTTYHYNSGGEPENITDLGYEQLQEFYKKHYHPSNAIFLTFGDIPASEHQENFQSKVLHRFTKLDDKVHIGKEERYLEPQTKTEYFAPTDESSKGQLILGWLLGESSDLDQLLEAEFLSSVLLENSASPLRNLLETTALADSPSPITGIEDSNKEMMFMCGIEGADINNMDDFDNEVNACLQTVINDGVDLSYLEAILHQLEFSQREIGGDKEPFGLQLIFSAVSTAVHYGDVISVLNLEPAIEKLRIKIKDKDYIGQLINKLLLDNPHKVRLIMQPDTEYNSKKQKRETDKLQQIQLELSNEEKQEIVARTSALIERQNEMGDESLLPKVTKDDIPDKINFAKGDYKKIAELDGAIFKSATNGISYSQIVVDTPAFSQKQFEYLPYYCTIASELGCNGLDYKQVQHLQTAYTGGIGCYTSLRADKDDIANTHGYITFSGKALNRNFEKFSHMLQDLYSSIRFDEFERMADLVSQIRLRKENSITSNGHAYAMQAASSGISPVARLLDSMGGLTSIERIKNIDDQIKSGSGIEEFASVLSSISELIHTSDKSLLLIADQDSVSDNTKVLQKLWADDNGMNPAASKFALEKDGYQLINNIYVTNTQVNFCARAYPTVPSRHKDAAALSVLSPFLRNGYLHTAIREQGGAYGGGASQDSNTGSFKFYSYRDPRLQGTLDDFDNSLEWLYSNNHQSKQLEEAILGVISSLDKPSSPSGEAKKSFYNNLFGVTAEMRLQYRKSIIETSIDDLIYVARKYLVPEKMSSAVITNSQTLESSGEMGMNVIEI